MKFCLLLCTIIAVLVGASSPPVEATQATKGQAVVAVVNKAAPRNGTCSLQESSTLQLELLQPINAALLKYGFHQISSEAGLGDGNHRRLGADNCNWCINLFTPFQCNSWLNCNFRRRNLRRNGKAPHPKGDIAGLVQEWKATCHNSIRDVLDTHVGAFSEKCQAALQDADCIAASLD